MLESDWMADAVEGSPVAQDMAWWSPDSTTVRFIGAHGQCAICRCNCLAECLSFVSVPSLSLSLSLSFSLSLFPPQLRANA